MKKLIKYVAKIILTTIVLSYFFDFLYTNAHHNKAPRSKISWIKSTYFPDSLDYVLLGSSRCVHHLQPKIIKEKTGKTGVNLGYAACGPVEIKLMLEEIIKKTKTKQAYIQIGTKYNLEKPDNLAVVSWIPFIKDKHVYDELIKYDSKYFHYKYIPFYRYQKFDPKIGLRNISLSYLGKEGNFINTSGYIPIRNTLKDDSTFNYSMVKKENPIINEIIKECQKNNIELYFFTSPYHNSKVDFSFLNDYLPNYTDFSNTIANQEMFSDLTHLNHKGSTSFTNIFTEKYFRQ